MVRLQETKVSSQEAQQRDGGGERRSTAREDKGTAANTDKSKGAVGPGFTRTCECANA